jgi:hypothetical protein
MATLGFGLHDCTRPVCAAATTSIGFWLPQNDVCDCAGSSSGLVPPSPPAEDGGKTFVTQKDYSLLR